MRLLSLKYKITVQMKYKVLVIFSLAILGLSLNAESKIYGKLWVTIESQDNQFGNEIDLVSNTSRIGVKGSLDLKDNLEVIYQVEYEIDPADGKADELNDKTLKQRNSFIGLKGVYGTLFLGTHDTTFKRSHSKIDVFNDLAGDIKNILHGENRMKDFVGYTTPELNGRLSATFNAIRGTDEIENNNLGDSISLSLNYKTELFYAVLSVDSEVRGYDSNRMSIYVPFNKTKLGFIYQDTKKLSTGVEEHGHVVSLSRKVGDRGTLKVQIAKSDMKLDSGKQTSFGYDYNLSQELKIFFFSTDLTGKDMTKEKEIRAIGFEYKF
jgi:predicted porin